MNTFDTVCVKNELVTNVDSNGAEFTQCHVTWASADAGAAVTRAYKKDLEMLYVVGRAYPRIQILATEVKPYKIGDRFVDNTTVVVMFGESLEFALGKQGHSLPEKAVASPLAVNSEEILQP
jgi:hypothetical protein